MSDKETAIKACRALYTHNQIRTSSKHDNMALLNGQSEGIYLKSSSLTKIVHDALLSNAIEVNIYRHSFAHKESMS